MIIKGKYLREITEFRDCEIFVERGNLYDVTVPDLPPMSARSYVPQNKSEFSFERLPSKKRVFIPYDSNYVIEYLGKNGNTNRIYLKLNLFRRIKAKWVLRQYIIQSKEMKTGALKYIIGGIIGGIFGLIFGYIGSEIILQKHNETRANQTVNKSEIKKTESSNNIIKTDSIKADSLY